MIKKKKNVNRVCNAPDCGSSLPRPGLKSWEEDTVRRQPSRPRLTPLTLGDDAQRQGPLCWFVMCETLY